MDGRLLDSIDCLRFLSDANTSDTNAINMQTTEPAAEEKTLTSVEVRSLVAEDGCVAVAFDG